MGAGIAKGKGAHVRCDCHPYTPKTRLSLGHKLSCARRLIWDAFGVNIYARSDEPPEGNLEFLIQCHPYPLFQDVLRVGRPCSYLSHRQG